jgi:putative transposase
LDRPERSATGSASWGEDAVHRTGGPWENGYIESFNARLRNELLDGEIFYTLEEVRLISGWLREHYNKIRPHSALGNRPPAPQAILPRWPIGSAALRSSPTLAAEPAMN